MDSITNLPIVTKLLLIVNIILFGVKMLLPSLDLDRLLALHYFENDLFQPHQLITHIFMHANLPHIFFNMYSLAIFGSALETKLGMKKYIILYFISAIGAFSLQTFITWHDFSAVSSDTLNLLKTEGTQIISEGKNYVDSYLANLNIQFNSPMEGASGAIMGILIGFAILYPNAKLQIFFIPISIKAKYFLPVYMIIELVLGVSNFEWDNIAHFAHLGGAIMGGLLLLFWIKTNQFNQERSY